MLFENHGRHLCKYFEYDGEICEELSMFVDFTLIFLCIKPFRYICTATNIFTTILI